MAGLAQLAEDHGYQSFWFNLRAGATDPFSALKAITEQTKAIEVGIGVFPLDAYSAEEIARKIKDQGLSSSRIILGLASGKIVKGGLHAIESAAAHLRVEVPACRIAIGGYGPKVLSLAGGMANVALGNWLTPERLSWVRQQVAIGASLVGRQAPDVYLYHRAAQGDSARARLSEELTNYRKYPVHQRHQQNMGNPAMIGIAANSRMDIELQLQPYRDLCLPVLKLLPEDGSDVAEWETLVRFFRPDS